LSSEATKGSKKKKTEESNSKGAGFGRERVGHGRPN